MKHLNKFLAIILGYTLFGYLGLNLASINIATSPIWPASGIAVGMLILFGRQYTPAVFIGSFLVNYSVSGFSFLSLFMAFGNMSEAYVTTSVLIWAGRFFPNRIYSEIIFILVSSMVGAAISSTIGNIALLYLMDLPRENFSISWFTWWSGNAMGTVLIAPLFLEFKFYGNKSIKDLKPLYSILTGLLMIALIFFIFVSNLNEAFAWAFGALFIISGITIGRPFAKIMLILVSALVIILTTNGYGLFELGTLNSNLIYLQMLLLSYALSVLFINPLTTNFKIQFRYILGILFGWLCVFVAVYNFSKNEDERTLSDFTKLTEAATQHLVQTGLRYEALIISAESLYKMKPQMTAAEWREFASNQRLDEYYEAISGIVLTERVMSQNLKSYIKAHNFDLRTINPDFASKYNDHFIVHYIEPIETNPNVIGLDVGSESARRESIEKSYALKRPIASRNIVLVQDEQKRKSFNLMKTITNSKGEIIGSIHLPTIHENFYKRVLQRFDHIMNIRVKNEDEIVYDDFSENVSISGREPFVIKKNIFFFGRNFEILFYPTQSFFLNYAGQASTIALLLNFFLLLISAFLLEQLTQGQKAETLVNERTAELEKSKLQLVQSSKMASLGEMAGSMAHEINNPLTIILGKLNTITMTLRDMNVKSEPVDDEISKIKKNVDRIDRIVKGLKNYSRSSFHDPFELSHLKEIIMETLDLCLETLKAENINVIVKDIPSVFLHCRQGQISQVLINLLNNSRDAIAQQPDKWIEIDFDIDKKSVRIFVTDSGPGIPKEVIANIMTPFFTTKMRNKGTGLGLSISKDIVEIHNGKIWIDENYPHTRFVIELPLATEEA